MRVYVNDPEGHKIFIPLPSSLIFSGITAEILNKYAGSHLRDKDINISREQWMKLFRALRHSSHLLKGQPLVEVYSADGAIVRIML